MYIYVGDCKLCCKLKIDIEFLSWCCNFKNQILVHVLKDVDYHCPLPIAQGGFWILRAISSHHLGTSAKDHLLVLHEILVSGVVLTHCVHGFLQVFVDGSIVEWQFGPALLVELQSLRVLSVDVGIFSCGEVAKRHGPFGARADKADVLVSMRNLHLECANMEELKEGKVLRPLLEHGCKEIQNQKKNTNAKSK